MSEDDDNVLEELTDTQEQVLDYIEDCIADHLPPTYAEIAKHFGWKSPNAAHDCVAILARKKRIVLIPGVARGIKLVDP
jgi:repressor LexA